MKDTQPPQSVVVPLEDWRHVIGALKNAMARLPMGVAIGNVTDALAKVEHLQAAPAPSSLAGVAVEKLRALLERHQEERRMVRMKDTGAVYDTTLDLDTKLALAALSPEAPAREGVVKACADFQEAIDYFEADVADALAEDSERADLWDREVTVNIDALKTVMNAALTPRHEAPASAVDDLVDRFAAALKEKLRAAEAKYGHDDDAWMRDDWRDDLIWQLGEHVQKGDPRDVAAYCAFAWHHGWSVGPFSVSGENGEAPAEGAGERECLAIAIDPSLAGTDFSGLFTEGSRIGKALAAADRVLVLRARSSAPEAREGEAVTEDAGRQAIWAVVHEVWQLLDDGETDIAGKTTVDQERWQAVSDAMDKLEALVPDTEGPFWGGYPVNYFWPKAAEVFPASGNNPAAPSADHAELTRLAEAAGEEALGNLLAVIHGDGGHRALEVGTKQAALEAEKIVADLLSSAPEAREDAPPFAWAYRYPDPMGGTVVRLDTNGREVNGSKPQEAIPLYTHPAAPSADKLRIAVEALGRIAHEPRPVTRAAMREYAAEALAALKAEN